MGALKELLRHRIEKVVEFCECCNERSVSIK
jgi:hypothetical protein